MMENDEKQIFDELIVEKYKQKLKQISSDEQDDYLLFNPEKSSTKIDDNLQVFKDYLDMISNPRSVSSNTREGVNLDIDDNIVVLSTCLNSGEGRYLVQGVLINDEQTK